MIVSKPHTRNLLSFSLFLLLTLVVLSINILVVMRDPQPAWYHYLVILLLIPIGLLVANRIFIRYKIVKLGNNQVEVHFPVMRRKRKYPLDQIRHWKETAVKTGKSTTYKELEILFTDEFRITLGQPEVSEYARVIQYLAQKAGKKRLSL